MTRRGSDVHAAINAEQTLDVAYGPDPRGWGMAAALAGAHHRDLTTKRAVIDTSSTPATGWLRPLQAFRGLAPLMGSGLPRSKKSSTIGDERSDPGQNAAERILAERWARRAEGPSW